MSSYNTIDPKNSTLAVSNPNSSEALMVYRFVMFCVPILFTFMLLFLFYLFYLRPRRVNWSSLRMRTTSSSSPNHLPFSTQQEVESGLKKEVREMLPIIIYKESFSVRDTQCSVCLGDYEAEDRLQQIPACGHTFHIDCIDHWLTTHTTCPLCRLSLLSSAKSPVELSHIRVENSQCPSVAENDSGTSFQQNSQPSPESAELRAQDTTTLHTTAEESAGRSHCADHAREQLECKGQVVNE